MKTVLMTGTTGFLGSAMAASLLNRGHRVVSISRNDPDGERARSAIQRASVGFKMELSPSQWANLKLVECQFQDLEAELATLDLGEVTDVWHCAAHMSYSPKKLDEALRQNLEITTELYELVQSRASQCRRFFHVSTAYTAGVAGGPVQERLHPRPKLINAYQISKWSAEQALANLCREPGALPVTIFRPTIVVGHSQTGWSPGSRFGYFMFVDAFASAALIGVREVTVDISAEGRPNLIPVDEVANAMTGLTEREGRAKLEIFHCANPHSLGSEDHLNIIGKALGIRIKAGQPLTPLDHKIQEAIQWNREFASIRFDFDVSGLAAALEQGFCQEPMTESDYALGVEAFLKTTQTAREAMLRPQIREIARIVQ